MKIKRHCQESKKLTAEDLLAHYKTQQISYYFKLKLKEKEISENKN